MKKSSLTKILIDWITLFHDINLKHNGVIVIPRFSTVCGSVRTSFGDIGEKFTTAISYEVCFLVGVRTVVLLYYHFWTKGPSINGINIF